MMDLMEVVDNALTRLRSRRQAATVATLRTPGCPECLDAGLDTPAALDEPLTVWTAAVCEKRVSGLMMSGGDPIDFWRQATRWLCRHGQQGPTQAAWARACFGELEGAWDALGGDSWAQRRRGEGGGGKNP